VTALAIDIVWGGNEKRTTGWCAKRVAGAKIILPQLAAKR